MKITYGNAAEIEQIYVKATKDEMSAYVAVLLVLDTLGIKYTEKKNGYKGINIVNESIEGDAE